MNVDAMGATLSRFGRVDSCFANACPGAQVCGIPPGKTAPECFNDPCLNVQCDNTSFCKNGQCVAICPACLDTEKCVNGACVNDPLMQFQADILGTSLERPVVQETTALGAAYLAGIAVGFWKNTGDVARNWALDKTFKPAMNAKERQRHCAAWNEAVKRSRNWVR